MLSEPTSGEWNAPKRDVARVLPLTPAWGRRPRRLSVGLGHPLGLRKHDHDSKQHRHASMLPTFFLRTDWSSRCCTDHRGSSGMIRERTTESSSINHGNLRGSGHLRTFEVLTALNPIHRTDADFCYADLSCIRWWS